MFVNVGVWEGCSDSSMDDRNLTYATYSWHQTGSDSSMDDRNTMSDASRTAPCA